MIKINKGIEPVELTKYKQQPNASYRDMHGAPSGKSNSDGTPIDVYTIAFQQYRSPMLLTSAPDVFAKSIQ